MRDEQPTKCVIPLQKLRVRLAQYNMFKLPENSITDRFKTVVLLRISLFCFCCQSFGDVSPYVSSYEGHPISSDNDLIKRKLFL